MYFSLQNNKVIHKGYNMFYKSAYCLMRLHIKRKGEEEESLILLLFAAHLFHIHTQIFTHVKHEGCEQTVTRNIFGNCGGKGGP